MIQMMAYGHVRRWAQGLDSRAGVEIAAGLIAADMVVLALHGVRKLTFLIPSGYSLATDGGLSEIYQYAKWVTLAALAFLLCARRRSPVYAALGVVFTYLLLDDWLQIHERMGEVVVNGFGLRGHFRLRAVDYGELFVSAAAGSVLLSQLAMAYRMSRPEDRRPARVYVALLALLAFFGVVVDMVHVMLLSFRDLLELIEDGGEIVTVSLMVGYMGHLYWSDVAPVADAPRGARSAPAA